MGIYRDSKRPRKMCINIKMPLEFKFIVKQSEEKMNILRNLCFEIYEDDDEYAATSVEVSVLADKVTEIEIEEIEKVIIENSVYQSFIKELYDMNIDEVEKGIYTRLVNVHLEEIF